MARERGIDADGSRTTRSRQRGQGRREIPGGNRRTTTIFDRYPLDRTRVEGRRIWGAGDGQGVEVHGNCTSLILGHANPRASHDTATRGVSFPGPTEHEIRLAGLLTRPMPALEFR